ncbi:inactive protein RESTRICTED TEV MOVEMENT 2-like [Andrographis paniculata]|uniref:inactive protein RESTRICTED TEV MOVEMENT 2-like n=1 Tax=Andrographis paniculata TaxID=175694 RepID=UPI0021E885CA|nr:inactive protein RESTRICTED TEV MOVEMENT 2-like [Andrographis paniculata]
MAARRQHGGGGGATPRRAAVRLVYEDIKPTGKWREDAESHILTIDLPGFVKEQLKVSTEGNNFVKVQGERPVTRARRIRFQEDYPVPANCDMRKIRANFQGESLIITIGKKIVDKPKDAPSPAIATPAEVPKQPLAPQGKDKDEVEDRDRDRDEHNQPPPPAVEASQLNDEKNFEHAAGEDGIKRDQPGDPRDGRRGTPFRDAGRVLPRDYEIREAIKKDEIEKTSKRSEELPEEGTTEKAELKDGAPSAKEVKHTESNGKRKAHTDGASAMKKGKKAVNGLNMLNERKSVVNMGAAVLVIIALTAYTTYQFTSGKHKI